MSVLIDAAPVELKQGLSVEVASFVVETVILEEDITVKVVASPDPVANGAENSSPSSDSNDDVSIGAVVGIAIAAAALGALVSWLLVSMLGKDAAVGTDVKKPPATKISVAISTSSGKSSSELSKGEVVLDRISQVSE